ncbi:MAG TPA: DUF6279 family lipoprotein [Polyangiales bacterium]|nr:DUF6279 family lipoprotein [Polyangiales bacterium]
MPRIVGLLFLLLFTGCSSERIAGWYITRKIDGYFDLSSEQKHRVRATVDDTIEYVRREELSHWISLLREVRQGFHDGMTDERLAKLQLRYDQRIDVAVHILVPRVAPLLVQLDAEQLDHFTKRVNEDLAEAYEDLELTPEKRREKLEQKALELVEDFVGSLSDEQEVSVRALIRKLPNERDKQYRAARDNLAHFRAFLGTRPTAPALESELDAMWEHRYDALGTGHEKEARRGFQRQWLLSVFQLLTPKQRAHAEEELSDRIRMLKRYVLPAES